MKLAYFNETISQPRGMLFFKDKHQLRTFHKSILTNQLILNLSFPNQFFDHNLNI